jgi:glutamate-1-semialdehyde 2,1-aminomutase
VIDADAGRVEALLHDEQRRFDELHPKSLKLNRDAERRFLFGVPMPWMLAWPGRAPVFVQEAHGATLRDVDANEYVDFCLGDTASMTGHAPAATVAAATAQLGRGLSLMLPIEDALGVSDDLASRFGLPQWQFTLSATDANRHALRYARHVTGRSKVLIFDRCYHGTVDECFASDVLGEVVAREGSMGPPVAPSLTTRVVQFNDEEAVARELAAGDVACILTEPALTNIGIVLPQPGFHEMLRRAADETGTLLLIDETHTISAGPGGWTAAHGLKPDMLVVGKPIGGGVPAAALGLTESLAQRLAEDFDSDRSGMRGVGGTMAANALSVTAMRATLAEVLTPEAYRRMDAVGTRLADGIDELIRRRGLPWHVQRIGGRVEYHFSAQPLRNGREGVAIINRDVSRYIHLFALNRGVIVFPFHNRVLASPAHTDADADRHAEVLDAAVAALWPL